MSTPTTIFLICSLLLIALGIGSVTGGSNNILYTSTNAQLEDGSEEEEFQTELAEQNQNNQSAAAPSRLSLKLDRAHFIPLTPLSDSPGNQVKMLLKYNDLIPSFL